MPSKTIPHNLDSQTRPGDLVKKLDGEKLLCTACGHLCKLRPGQRGICKVRFNSEAHRPTARKRVKKRFLFDGVVLQAC